MARPVTIEKVDAWQVLDSRGVPTVCARVQLSDGSSGSAAAPAGASTGAHEAVELRDGGTAWEGRGVLRAISNVRGEIADHLRGRAASDLTGHDTAMRELDGTSDLSRLGANAVLAVSISAALGAANSQRTPLWNLFTETPLLPMPMVNMVSGGAHAGRFIDIQDVLVIPVGAETFAQAIEWAARVRRATAAAAERLGLPASLVADEGGLAGRLPSNRDAIALVASGVAASGLDLGTDVSIAIDVAASQLLMADGTYRFACEGRTLQPDELISEVDGWCSEFSVVSVEDLLAEDDWNAWVTASRVLRRVQLVGDDLFATNEVRLRKGIELGAANSVLVKVNQIGTVSSAREVQRTATDAGYATVVSARSGDTEDTWLADLAVGWSAGQIKVGSTMRSERLAKWNRLLAIAHDRPDAPLAGWPPMNSTTRREENE